MPGASVETHLLKFSLFYEILTGFYLKLAQNKPLKVYKSLKIYFKRLIKTSIGAYYLLFPTRSSKISCSI